MSKKRVIYMGTPHFAASILEHLLTFPIEVVGVVTQRDKPVGRKQILTQPPVKVVALKHNLNVYQPSKVKKLKRF
jgi:methionyl-tRNA formyltransferase